MSELAPAAQLSIEQATAHDEGMWARLRTGKLSKVVLTGALLATPAAGATPAEASEAGCYGDYCSGQYPDQMGCDEDARTLSSTVLSKSGGSLGVNVGPVAASSGGDNGEIGVIELRWSEKCGTAWARLRTNRANDVTYVGIEKDDGYWQQISVNGNIPGSPAANSFTPMIYGRGDSQFRAYVFSQELYDITPDNAGTYWMNPQEPQQ